jgi:hypothetical protein
VSEILDRNEVPAHVSSVRMLDCSGDYFVDRLAGPWIRLGAWNHNPAVDRDNVADEIMRQCVLIPSEAFALLFDKLRQVGILNGLDRPGGTVYSSGRDKEYIYFPFHQFAFPFTNVIGEPLVFVHANITSAGLFVNPDLWMSLQLEERTAGNGIWWDPRRAMDVLIQRVSADNLHTVDIRADYLLRYLQMRQMSLLIGHYRQLQLFHPSQGAIDAFVKEDLVVGSPESGTKAFFENWGLRRDDLYRGDYLQRRLHLWIEIKPSAIDIENPWEVPPSFDTHDFTLPTKFGQVAPARWRRFRDEDDCEFAGTTCDFMDAIYFRQEVLTKYEVTSGFEVKDNGSVSNIGYWSLTRSTSRIGNELLTLAIGDFAEGVPFEEWPHWEQYAVEPPSEYSLRAIHQEIPIPKSVNSLLRALQQMNAAFSEMANGIGLRSSTPLWRGSLDSLAGRQLKWVYPASAGDDEFIKRATLTSTLFLDGLQSSPMREFLNVFGMRFHESFEKTRSPLGSRKLLQRTALAAAVIAVIQPKRSKVPSLVKAAEGKGAGRIEADLERELLALNTQIREEFSPLAFLYDLRLHGGLAHPPNKKESALAAAKLGLPKENWHRTDYLALLELVRRGFERISEHFRAARDKLEEITLA